MPTAIESLFSKQERGGLNRDAPTPMYHQLYTLLKGVILDGTLALGDRMPTEEQLSKVFNISRITAKRSMDELANENLVERRRGKGSHVIYKYMPKPVKAPLIGMLEEIESMARNTRAVIFECSMKKPPQFIREKLELNVDETALYLVRVREREGIKFAHYTSWTKGVKMSNKPGTLETKPRLTYFRENGLLFTHVTQTISATAATQEVADALGVDKGSPLLSLTRYSYSLRNDQEQLMDYLHVLYNPEHFQYKMDLKID